MILVGVLVSWTKTELFISFRILKVACFVFYFLSLFFLATQIMELHKKIKPLEDQISDLKERNTDDLAGEIKCNISIVIYHEINITYTQTLIYLIHDIFC